MLFVIINHSELSLMTTVQKNKNTQTTLSSGHDKPFSFAWFELKCQESFIKLNTEICYEWVNE